MNGIETTADFEEAQELARLLEQVADMAPGWMVDESGLRKVIDTLYEVEDPGDEDPSANMLADAEDDAR